MIFEGANNPKQRIGICPICDQEAEVIDSIKGLDKEPICTNEFYRHFKSNGVSYIYKRKNISRRLI